MVPSEAKKAVIVVPMFAPRVIGKARSRLSRPAPASGISSEVVIELDPERLTALGIDASEVVAAIAADIPPTTINGDDDADVTMSADTDTFRAILDGDLNPTSAFMTGRLKIDGDMGAAMRLGAYQGQMAERGPAGGGPFTKRFLGEVVVAAPDELGKKGMLRVCGLQQYLAPAMTPVSRKARRSSSDDTPPEDRKSVV